MKVNDKDMTADDMEAEILRIGAEAEAEELSVPAVKDEAEIQEPVKKEEEGDQEPEFKVESVDEVEAKAKAEAEEADKAKEVADKAAEDAEKAKESNTEEQKTEEQKKTDDAMAKMRIENKELREKSDALETEKRETAIRQEEREKIEKETSDASAPTPDQTFEYLAQAIISEDAAMETAAKRAVMDALSSADIVTVLEKAEAGGFGKLSADISELATTYLPRVISQEGVAKAEAAETETEATHASEELTKRYTVELKQVNEEHPDLSNAESDKSKAYLEWSKKNIGSYDKTGNRVETGELSDENAAYFITHPSLMVKTFMESFKPSVSPEMAKLQSENAEYRKKLHIADAPEDSTGQHNNSKDTGESADDLLARITAMSVPED